MTGKPQQYPQSLPETLPEDVTAMTIRDRIWYVAFGSNINKQRFMRYLEGDKTHSGARDATEPAADVFAQARLRLDFAGHSRWGGGVCFVTEDDSTFSWVRAWDITREQFEDVYAQENGSKATGESLPWDQLLSKQSVTVGSGYYGRIIRLDLAMATADQPAMTFTWSKPKRLNPPSKSYKQTIEAGLIDNPRLNRADILKYLAARIPPSTCGAPSDPLSASNTAADPQRLWDWDDEPSTPTDRKSVV